MEDDHNFWQSEDGQQFWQSGRQPNFWGEMEGSIFSKIDTYMLIDGALKLFVDGKQP